MQYYYRREKTKIVETIELTNLKQRMRWIKDDGNVFKRVGLPRKSLLEYSNQLTKETFTVDKEMFKQLERRPINL